MITALALELPQRTVTNDELRARHPRLVAEMERQVLGRLWKPTPGSRSARFDDAAAPYMSDPFRGCVERRWLDSGEHMIDLEERAARKALALVRGSVDLVLCCSMLPAQWYAGNAAFLARRLALQCPAWNLESMCSGSLVALQTAAALIASGQHTRVLVVTSCTYSKMSPEDDTLGWGNGDAAAAFVVEQGGFVSEDAAAGRVYHGAMLGSHSISTQVTCGSVYCDLAFAREGDAYMRMRTTADAGRVLRETAEPFLRTCVDGALSKAGIAASEIDALICNTPTAWYGAFCADVLGIPETKTVNAHPLVANVGPALFPANLALAAHQGLIRPGAVALCYAVGSVSNATASVIRCGEIRVAS